MLGNTFFSDYLKAGNSATPKEMLESLSTNEDPRIRKRVAENEGTPAFILAQLAVDSDPEVRVAAGTNQATPVDVVFALLLDPDPTVRYGLAEDPHAPIGVLRKLTLDENAYVSARAQKTLSALLSSKYKGKAPSISNVVAFPSNTATAANCMAT
jgi:hypothetical protein